MKTPKNAPLPAVAFSIVEHEVAGNYIVTFAAPSRFAALLPEHDGFHVIASANVSPSRKRIWRTGKIERNRTTITGPEMLECATAEPFDAMLRVRFPAAYWSALAAQCNEIGITPGQFLLASAWYNAEIEEEAIEDALAAL